MKFLLTRIQSVEGSRQRSSTLVTITQTVEVMESQRKHLEKYLPRLENSVETAGGKENSARKAG